MKFAGVLRAAGVGSALVALTVLSAQLKGVTNFTVFSNHVTIVPPLKAILESPDLRLNGFLGPGHVSTVVGQRPYRFVPAEYGLPLVAVRGGRRAAGWCHATSVGSRCRNAPIRRFGFPLTSLRGRLGSRRRCGALA